MKSYLLYVSFLIALLGEIAPAIAGQSLEDRRYTLENTRFHQIKSRHTGHLHELIVSLPENYSASGSTKYPVFYYLDAYWDTGLLSGIYGNLRFDNVIPELIMVGLSYPESGVYDQERRRDFSPTDVGAGTGGADRFHALLEKEAIPFVENHYRVSSERALGGVSMGGLFGLYAMYKNPGLFRRYIAISPAVEWDNEYLSALDAHFHKSGKAMPARLFLSYGTDEYPKFRDPIVRFQRKIAGRDYEGLALQNFAMEGLRHTGVKGDGYARGLMWVWKDMAPSGPSGLERLFQTMQPPKQE